MSDVVAVFACQILSSVVVPDLEVYEFDFVNLVDHAEVVVPSYLFYHRMRGGIGVDKLFDV